MIMIEKGMQNMSKIICCKHCAKIVTAYEVGRVYGTESAPYLQGFCSASCYTKSIASNQLPQTDNTRTISVNVYDAKVFITKIESQIEILEMVNKHDEAKHWKTLLKSANELLNVNS